jgi:hypothetical protein
MMAIIHVEVTTGEGVTVKLQLPPTATGWIRDSYDA